MRGKFDYSSLKRFGDDLEALDKLDAIQKDGSEPDNYASVLGSQLQIS